MKKQIKIITTSLNLPKEHADSVNEFLRTRIEIVNIDNIMAMTPNARRTDAELVTIITYKEML